MNTQISAAVVLIRVCWIICGKGAVLNGLFMVVHLRSYIKNSTQYFIRYPDTCTLKSVFKHSATPRFSTHFSVSGYRIKPCLSFLIYLTFQTRSLFMIIQSKANKWQPFGSGGWILIPNETPDKTPAPSFHLRWNIFFIWDQILAF